MPNMTFKDSEQETRSAKTSGAGTDEDPFVGHVNIDSTVSRSLTSTPLGVLTEDDDASVAAVDGLLYCGFSARETTGAAAAVFNIIHGATASGGTVLESVSLSKGESASDRFYGDDAASGISVEIVSGSVDLTIKTRIEN